MTQALSPLPHAQFEEETKDSLMNNYEEVVQKMEDIQLSKGKKRTSMKDFKMITTLGSGTYGKVVLVRHKET